MTRNEIHIAYQEYTRIDIFPSYRANNIRPELTIHSDGKGRLVVRYEEKIILDVPGWNGGLP